MLRRLRARSKTKNLTLARCLRLAVRRDIDLNALGRDEPDAAPLVAELGAAPAEVDGLRLVRRQDVLVQDLRATCPIDQGPTGEIDVFITGIEKSDGLLSAVVAERVHESGDDGQRTETRGRGVHSGSGSVRRRIGM